MAGQLSTAKSPQQMFGAVAKSYYASLLNVDPARIFCISVMPCVAKKPVSYTHLDVYKRQVWNPLAGIWVWHGIL